MARAGRAAANSNAAVSKVCVPRPNEYLQVMMLPLASTPMFSVDEVADGLLARDAFRRDGRGIVSKTNAQSHCFFPAFESTRARIDGRRYSRSKYRVIAPRRIE